MEYFACGFAVALFMVSILIYFVIHNKDQKNKSPEDGNDKFVRYFPDKTVKTEGEPEKDCFLIIFDKKEKTLKTPKYNHAVKGPMAIDVYQWITGNDVEEDE